MSGPGALAEAPGRFRMPMDSRLFNYDPLTGITEIFHYDDVTETVTMELRQETPLDDLNAAAYNAHSDYGPARWKGDWHHVASIPLVELVRLQQEGVIDHQGTVQDNQTLLKLLNDRDYLKFRTKPGHL